MKYMEILVTALVGWFQGCVRRGGVVGLTTPQVVVHVVQAVFYGYFRSAELILHADSRPSCYERLTLLASLIFPLPPPFLPLT